MEMTAVVLNAGLGDISFGLQMAGFSIIAAYETDLKAAAVHEANIEAPVFRHPPKKSGLEMISSADLLAARLTDIRLSNSPGKQALHDEARDNAEDSLLQLLDFCQPKALLAVLSPAAAKSKALDRLLYSISQKDFLCSWAVIDTARTVGMPVAERKVFLMGIRAELRRSVGFPEQVFTNTFPLEKFLQPVPYTVEFLENSAGGSRGSPSKDDAPRNRGIEGLSEQLYLPRAPEQVVALPEAYVRGQCVGA